MKNTITAEDMIKRLGLENKPKFSLHIVIYWFLYPFRNSYKNKLRALLEGLETQNVDKLLKEGKTGDFRNYGKTYIGAVRTKVDDAKNL